jgi:hypothetical protein
MGTPGTAPNNQKATIALVAGIASLVFAFCCSILGVALGGVAAFLGNQAKGEIARSGGTQGGANFAQYGFITGIVGIVLGVIMIILSLVLNVGGGITNLGT